MENETVNAPVQEQVQQNTKFCKHCGKQINAAAVICPNCGCQVEDIAPAAQPNIVINNANTNANTNTIVYAGHPKNKWVALLLCFFLGFLGAHKFYEGKIGTGILYILTFGVFGIGVLIDFIALLFKPVTYYV